MALQVGIIGAGWWASYAHIPAVFAHPKASLRSVQKRDAIEARRVADHFGIERAFSCERQLLEDDQLDAVIIASTPNAHHRQAKAALNAGKHVLLEKPMTLTAAEAAELVDLAEAKDRQLLISCPWHYTCHGRESRKLITEGRLGTIKMISVLMTNPIDNLLRGRNTEVTHGTGALLTPAKGSYSDPAVAGGGQIYCQVSHAAAYLTYLTGAHVVDAYARFDNSGAAVDLYNVLTLTMSDGSLVSLASTGVTPTTQRHYEVRVFGTNGVLSLDLWQGKMNVATLDGGKTDYAPLAESEIYPERAPANNLIDAALGLDTNQSPGTLGLAAMQVIEAACASAQSAELVQAGAGQ
ncbi:MAG: Gfo/Idh/MocA family protein [Tepidisphaeraceae bacterium]